VNPDPNLVVEALLESVTCNVCYDHASVALPHAEAIAERWPALTHLSGETLLAALDKETATQEFIAAAREHIGWHGSAGHERLRTALKNLEEEA